MSKIHLNIGCGENPIEGLINIDCVKNDFSKPDVVCHVGRQALPYDDDSVDEIWMIHAIEHVEMVFWHNIFGDFRRVLKPNGILLLSYPEFSECSKRFLSNDNNQRNFWRATLYGRQLYDSDYHVVPMHSPELKETLESAGFYRVAYQPESELEPFNTTLIAKKDPAPVTREQVLVKELHLDKGRSSK